MAEFLISECAIFIWSLKKNLFFAESGIFKNQPHAGTFCRPMAHILLVFYVLPPYTKKVSDGFLVLIQ